MTITDSKQFKRRLAEQTGLDFDLLEQPAFDNFVRRRCSQLGMADEAAYHELACRDPREMERLVQEVSVAETWFFRYPASFELVVDHSANLLRRQQEKLRMLSIACATGEEPYGMAMAAAAGGWPLERVRVDAVDRNEASLSIARKACYRRNSFREPVPPWAEKWFSVEDDATSVDPRIVATVSLSLHDILSRSLPGSSAPYDVVCCRNLFIYLGSDARTKLINYLLSMISPNGILFVGHAEHSILPTESFETAGVRQAFALRPKQPNSILPTSRAILATPNSDAIHKHQEESVSVPNQKAAPKLSRVSDPDAIATVENARALANVGELEAAIKVLEDLQPLRPTRPDVFELLGSIQLSLSRLDQAHDSFSRVLYFEPDNETALLQMAIVCSRLGDSEKATRFRRRAARVHTEESKTPE